MLLYTMKLTMRKAILGIVLLCAVIGGIRLLSAEETRTVFGEESISCKLKTNAERVAFLKKYGIEVDETPVTETEVRIPEVFDEAYDAYNDLQKTMGFDLEKYRGKKADLYIYQVRNDPSGEEGVTASLVLRRDRLIAADVSSAQADGFMRGLTDASAQ